MSRRKLQRELQIAKLVIIHKNQETKRAILKDKMILPFLGGGRGGQEMGAFH